MRFVGFKEIAITSIHHDAPDIRKRMQAQHVQDLADDAEQNGGEYMHPPVVRVDGYRLIAGRDRLAGALLKKRKRIWVHLAECNDDEAKALELAENIYRRPLDKDQRAQAISALVKLREQQERAIDEAKRAAGEKVSASPANTPIARARKGVARTAGVSAETVRKHERRAAKPAEQAEKVAGLPGTVSQVDDAPPEAAATPLPAGFRDFGLPMDEAKRSAVVETLAWLKDFEADATRVVREMTSALKHGAFTVNPNALEAVKQAAQTLGHALREAMPAGLCFYCKDQPGPKVNCNGCGGVGIVGRHAGDHVPRELLGTEVVMVAVNGQIVPLADAGSAPPAPKKNGRPIRVDVVDEVGAAPRELTLEREDAAAESEELF